MTGKPRIHWFWRTAIALVVAGTYGGLMVGRTLVFGPSVHEWVQEAIRNALPTSAVIANGIGSAVAWFVPTALLTLVTFGLLSYWRRPYAGDGETRCRKCHYILRGISEPRCPECGEGI